ncbi:MAG: ThuA domain-containing protein [Pirellulales bacterium]|nr:ThuA domain-containing protein [Pirellulales bacterium]
MNRPASRPVYPFACLLVLGTLGGGTLQAAPPSADDAPKRIVLVDDVPDGHPAGTHEFAAGQTILTSLLANSAPVRLDRIGAQAPGAAQATLLDGADGVVLYLSQGALWATADPRRHEALTRLAARGGGIVALHWAVGAKPAETIAPFVQLIGGCHGGPDRKYTVTEAEVRIATPEHPILRGVSGFRVRDEFYYQLKWALPPEIAAAEARYAAAATPEANPAITPLWEVAIDDQPRTVAWAWQRPDGGRSCGFTTMHFHENWRRAEYRRAVTQAVMWSVGLDVPEGGVDVALPEEAFGLPASAQP